jgi:pentatricopeptide repeat protein
MRNVEPNETTYHLLLACACEAGDIEQATEIVSTMKAKSYPASESVFAALVLGHARAG